MDKKDQKNKEEQKVVPQKEVVIQANGKEEKDKKDGSVKSQAADPTMPEKENSEGAKEKTKAAEAAKTAKDAVKKDKEKETVNQEKVQEKKEKASEDISKEETQPAAMTTTAKKKKKKIRRQILKGRAYIKSTYNNTIVTMTDMHGNVLAWSTAGNLGFKGAKKATSYAASQVVNDVEMKVQKYGLKELDVFVKGVGTGREAAIRALAQKGFSLNMIKDITPIPHNGCRPRKPRRV